MSRPSVRLVGVEAGYPGRPVLHGVNLEVPPGGFLGIAGPNGAGKTTLFKVILGFLVPTQGQVEVLGTPLSTPRSLSFVRRRIGYVPQQMPSGKLPFTVCDSVLAGRWGSFFSGLRRPSRADRSAVASVLERLGLSPYEKVDLRELSGGLRQRVALARAVVREPELVLMDEPTTYLDAESQGAFFTLTRDLNRERRISFVVISHDQGLLAETCTTVLQVNGGRIVEKR